jgi:hypothetical protein
MKIDGASPEVKYFIISLCHHMENKAKTIKIESVKMLAKNLCVTIKSAQQGIRFLEGNGFILREKKRYKKVEVSSAKLEFTDNFYSYIDNIKTNQTIEIINTHIGTLLNSEDLVDLSNRISIKLFLLTLLAHADRFGVVRGLSIKDLNGLVGRFSKDRHRSQLMVLKRFRFITEYSAGMSGGILLGKEKSEYLVNFNHRSFCQHEKLNPSRAILLKLAFRDKLFSVHSISRMIYSSLYKRDGIVSSNQLVVSLLAEVKGNPKVALSNLDRAIRTVGNAFEGDVRAFQIQRYVSRLAVDLLRSLGKQQISFDAVYRHFNFEKLFSDKFLREVIAKDLGEIRDGDRLSRKPLNQQPRYYRKLELYMDEAIGYQPCKEQVKAIKGDYTEQISAIAWLVSLCVIYTAKEYNKLLTEKGLRLNKQTEAAIFSGKNEVSLYFFELGCIEE